MKNEIYPIQIQEPTPTGMHFREEWAYTCGHCTSVVMMRPERTRPRLKCIPCGRWICETNELCQKDCTPVYSLAEDQFQNMGKWGKLVPAIMAGETTEAGAREKGLLLP